MLLRGAFHPFPVGKMRPISTNWYSKCRISCINWSAERHTKTSTCFGFKVLMFNKQCLVDCCCEIGTAWLSKKTAATQGPMDRDFLVLFLGVDLPACVSEWICFWFSDKLSLPGLGTATCTDPGTTASSSTSSTHSTATTRRTKLFVL